MGLALHAPPRLGRVKLRQATHGPRPSYGSFHLSPVSSLPASASIVHVPPLEVNMRTRDLRPDQACISEACVDGRMRQLVLDSSSYMNTRLCPGECLPIYSPTRCNKVAHVQDADHDQFLTNLAMTQRAQAFGKR